MSIVGNLKKTNGFFLLPQWRRKRSVKMWSSITKWIVWLLVWSMRITCWPYTRLLSLCRRRKALPPIQNPLLLQSATTLAARIRNREVSCEDVVTAYIQRIRAVNPIINCVVQDRFEQALLDAKNVDLQLAAGSQSEEYLQKEKPLLGVPLTVKESIAVTGMSHNAGRVKPKGRVATEDAETVKLLRSAGAIPLLVSNTPELCMSWETYNNVTGRSNNPYDVRRTPGGSSGGEAALLAAAASVVGLGSDICGSGRLPANYCGIFGHKASTDYLSITGHIPFSTDQSWCKFFSYVPMCRYAEDLPLMLRAMLPDPIKREELRLDEPVDIKSIKLFYMVEDGSILTDKVHPEIKTAMKRAVNHFSDKYNIVVREVKIKELKEILQVAGVIMLRMKSCHSLYQKNEDNLEDWNSIIWTYIKYLTGQAKHTHPPLMYGPLKKYADSVSTKDYHEMLQLKKELIDKFQEMLGDNGVFLYPTFPHLANFHLQFYYKVLNVAYFALFNLLDMPVTACPFGLAKDGRPVGFQIAANKRQDRLIFAVAKEIEAAFGGWVPPPSSAESTNTVTKVEDKSATVLTEVVTV